MTQELKPHPAKYTDGMIPLFAKLLIGRKRVLDPFAGTGKLAKIKDYGFEGVVVCNELEEGWAMGSYPVDEWHIGDAEEMIWAKDGEFDAVCTSPTYGNRMADHFDSTDNSKRHTYRHYLGKRLSDNNTGKMQWSERYRVKHSSIFGEIYRVLGADGLLIYNVSDHIRKGELVSVSSWHLEELQGVGFRLVEHYKISTPRQRHGENGSKRVSFESVFLFKKSR